MGAVKAYLKEEADKINAVQVANLDKEGYRCVACFTKSRARLRAIYEVMACEGGCITGPWSQ